MVKLGTNQSDKKCALNFEKLAYNSLPDFCVGPVDLVVDFIQQLKQTNNFGFPIQSWLYRKTNNAN